MQIFLQVELIGFLLRKIFIIIEIEGKVVRFQWTSPCRRAGRRGTVRTWFSGGSALRPAWCAGFSFIAGCCRACLFVLGPKSEKDVFGKK